MVSDRLFNRACDDLQAQTKKVFELEQMNKALLARHNALVEAVVWERECSNMRVMRKLVTTHTLNGEDTPLSRILSNRSLSVANDLADARDEVDKLLEEK
ncbi:MAG: hypothetical protein RBR16_12200 [Syntrophus sp. (in: bacteria)]|nr:hypothetical protein [Syntrophus sp. (in: bacteria)]